MVQKSHKQNRFLLLQIVVLDLIGFSLIFPVTPHLLEFYLKGAGAISVDAWLPGASGSLTELWPGARPQDMIVLLGGVLGSIYAFLQFIFSPFWGQLSDRIGRRPVLIVTSLGLALSYLAWFFSTSFTAFVASRILGGIMAGNLSVASAAIADMSTQEKRSADMGLLGAAFGIGFVVGPVIGGLASQLDLSKILGNGSFFHPFSFCAFLSFLLSVLAAIRNYASLQETLPPGLKPLPRSFFQLARSVNVSIHKIAFVNFIYLLMFAGYEFTVTFFYKIDFNLSPMQIGLIFLYIGVLIAAGQGGLVRVLSRRFPEKKLALAGIALVPLALVFFAKSAPSVWISMLLIIPITIGTSLFQPSITALASLTATTDRQGLVMGYVRSAGSLSRALGPIIGATLYWAYGVFFTYTFLATLMIGAFLFTLGLKDARQIPEKNS